MKIIDKINAKSKNIMDNPGVTIACLGASTVQGCFEIYRDEKGNIDTVFEQENAYHSYMRKIFSILYPKVPINIINAGISGDTAEHGAKRLERDVLRHDPDLVILSFGKNDIWGGDEGLLKYISATKEIIRAVKERGIEIVYLTCSMLNTDVSPHITDEGIRELAEKTAKIQQDGTMDKYQNAVMELCRQEGVPVCDLYGDWKLMQKNGVNITELLANKINHPIRELNWLAAMSLVKTIMEN
ncbi:MAG: GDSL family lipase [Clostridia bacterium]|nr:GDSL family lipase [Clostridia bacterium]